MAVFSRLRGRGASDLLAPPVVVAQVSGTGSGRPGSEGAVAAGEDGPGLSAGRIATALTGTFHSKASRRPVTGDTGSHSVAVMPSAVHTGSRGARTARASHSRALPWSPFWPSSISAINMATAW